MALGFGAAVEGGFGATTLDVGTAVGRGVGVAIAQAGVVGAEGATGGGTGGGLGGADAGADALATEIERTVSVAPIGAAGGGLACAATCVAALGQLGCTVSAGAYFRPNHQPSAKVTTIAAAITSPCSAARRLDGTSSSNMGNVGICRR